MRIVVLVLFAITFLLTLKTASAANVCQGDVERLCSGVAGEGEVLACLKRNARELTPSCLQFAKVLNNKMKEVEETCRLDAQKLCPNVKTISAGVIPCLKGKRVSVSPSCKASLGL